jgi:uncharacterized SAM-binding protein YcdF (DUF218 family)
MKIARRLIRLFIRLLLITMVVVATLYLSRDLWRPWLYRFLDRSMPPQKVDVLVVLGGGDGGRAACAIRLYLQGYAPQILFSGAQRSLQLKWDVDRAINSRIPSSRVSQIHEVFNTWQEAERVLGRLQLMGATSALIITDSFHTRRTWAVYARRAGDIKITVTSCDDPRMSKWWWQNAYTREYVMAEYAKLPFYIIRYGIWPF